jgi:hypothetical protein
LRRCKFLRRDQLIFYDILHLYIGIINKKMGIKYLIKGKTIYYNSKVFVQN